MNKNNSIVYKVYKQNHLWKYKEFVYVLIEQICHSQRNLLFNLNNRKGTDLEEMDDDDDDHDWEDAEVGKILLTNH
jgi:hypothetical protein